MADKVKILIIRFSSIGDIVLTSPVVRCLKQQLEGDSEIHFITFSKYASILEYNPYIHQIHAVDELSSMVINELKSIGFDYVIDLHHNLRSMRLKSKLKVLSFSFNKLNPLKWLLVNFKINRLPDLHIVDRYMDTIKALGISYDGKGLDYFLPDQMEDPKLPEDLGQYTALVLGATHATKRPSDEHFKKLASLISTPIVIIGGPEEKALGESLAGIDQKRIINTAGKTNLHESALLIKNSQLVITPDTGMMHIAAAFNKDIVSIWGNTVPDFGMYPFLRSDDPAESEIHQVDGLSCRPCSKIGFKKCPKGHFKCMEDQDWEAIAEGANKRIEARS